MVLSVECKPYNSVITTPSGWNKVMVRTNGTTASGTDTGSVMVGVYVKVALGTESGSLTLAIASGNSAAAVINVYSKGAGTEWFWSQASGTDPVNGANFSGNVDSPNIWIDHAANDWIVMTGGINGDVGTLSAFAMTQSGVTFGTLNTRTNAAITTGNDSRLLVFDASISSLSSPSSAPSLTYTNASSGSGTIVALRLREITPGTNPYVVNSSQEGSDNSILSTITVPLPIHAKAGDLLLLTTSANGAALTFTKPSGWTQIRDVTQTEGRFYLAYRIMLAGDAAPAVTISSGAEIQGSITCIRNVDTTDPFGTADATNTGSSSTQTFSDVTPRNADDLLVYIVQVREQFAGLIPDFTTAPNGATGGTVSLACLFPNVATATTFNCAVAVWSQNLTATTAPGSDTTSTGNACRYSAETMCIKKGVYTPPAMLLTNNAEGGTSGTGVTTGNSGSTSGNAWDQVTAAGGTAGLLTFDNAHASGGSLAYKHAIGVTTDECYFMWSTATGGTFGTLYARVYFYVTANPTTTHKLVSILGGSTVGGRISLNTAGKLIYTDTSGTTIVTFTNAVALNAWNRVEFKVVGHTTAGVLEAKLYSADSVTAIETNTSTSQNTGTTALDRIRVGPTGTPVSSVTIWTDDIGLSEAGYLGPARTPSSGDTEFIGAIPI
jgi:hypothetical protein